MSEYIIMGGELYHYGVKGMKWGQHKYYNDNGSLNSLGKARKDYKDAKKGYKQSVKEYRKKAGWGIGIKGIQKAKSYEGKVNDADMKLLNAKAKYNAAKKGDNKEKAQKAEFETYRKAMQKSGIRDSISDTQSRGRSTRIYNSVKAQKGKAYADRMEKSVQNRAVGTLVVTAVVGVGMMAVSAYLENR